MGKDGGSCSHVIGIMLLAFLEKIALTPTFATSGGYAYGHGHTSIPMAGECTCRIRIGVDEEVSFS